jgi:hypothetical protein
MGTESELRDAFAVATQRVVPRPEPYQRLVDLRRRRARRRAGLAGVAAVAVASAVLAAGGGWWPGPAGGGRVAVGTPSAGAGGDMFTGVSWAAAPDADHLYAGVNRCRQAPESCRFTLLASADGGRSWTPRDSLPLVGTPVLVGAQTLLAWRADALADPAPGPTALKPPIRADNAVITTDGGRHWYPLTGADRSTAAVPAGGFALCMPPASSTCELYAVDPARHLMSRLATQPSLPSGTVAHTEVPFGVAAGPTLWVAGWGSGVSVAVSRDAGRTWSRSTPDPQCQSLTGLWHGTGGVAQMLCETQAGARRWYRTEDYGKTWRPLRLPLPLPFVTGQDEVAGPTFLADGSVVGGLSPQDGSGLRLWVLRLGGGEWRRIPTSGVPARAQVMQITPDGGLLLYALRDGTFDVYRSPDLRGWTRLTPR